jgi:peptidoglycan/LPS O-acetylase OafA/YrhL
MHETFTATGPGKQPVLLDFMRFALATLVIFSHSYALLAGGDHTEPLYRLSRGQITWGGLAVDAFFILSGYLITQSWLRSDGFADYLKKRVLRIYPAFAVAVAFGVLVVAPLTASDTLVIDPLSWLAGTLNLQGYSPYGVLADNPIAGQLNGSLWSISYEFWCYVGIAALGASAFLARRQTMLGLLVVSVGVSLLFIVNDLRPGGGVFGVVFGYPPFWARLLPYYLAGSVFYLYRDHLPLRWPIAAVALITLVLSLKLAHWGVALTFPVALGYVLIFVAHLSLPVLRSWSKPGDFSYGMYLYAFPIQQLLVHWRKDLTPMTLFALSAPLTLAMAVISWHAIEKPFLRLKRARPKVMRQPIETSAPRQSVV